MEQKGHWCRFKILRTSISKAYRAGEINTEQTDFLLQVLAMDVQKPRCPGNIPARRNNPKLNKCLSRNS